VLMNAAGGRGTAGGSPGPAMLAQQQAHQQGLHDLFATCARTFELASTSTQVTARLSGTVSHQVSSHVSVWAAGA
jgi:hypothetical protein